MTEMSRDGREGWTQEERDRFDAQADHEAWGYAWSVLHPLVQSTREIGSDELTQVMEKALAEVEGEVDRTREALQSLRGKSSLAKHRGVPGRAANPEVVIEPSYGDVLEELAVSRGFEGAEEVARRAAWLDPSFTVRELLEAPPGDYGTALDAVLHMSDEEKLRITAAFTRTFMSPSRLKRIGN